jgi:hypothetical protein
MWFKQQLSIRWMGFQAWWLPIGVQKLGNTIKQHVILFRYPMLHLVSHISESIRQVSSSNNFITNIFEWLHIGNVKEAYGSTNTANYIRQMFKHNDLFTGLDYMEETLSYLALQGWYDIDSANVFNLLSAADKWRSIYRAHLLRLQQCLDEPFFRPV